MSYGITLIIIGVIAYAALLIDKKADSCKIWNKISQALSFIGILSFTGGIISLMACLISVRWVSVAPIGWTLWLIGSFSKTLLGFNLGYKIVCTSKAYRSSGADCVIQKILNKVAKHQKTLCFIAIFSGICFIFASRMWSE